MSKKRVKHKTTTENLLVPFGNYDKTTNKWTCY